MALRQPVLDQVRAEAARPAGDHDAHRAVRSGRADFRTRLLQVRVAARRRPLSASARPTAGRSHRVA